MNELQAAVEARRAQLNRQINATKNPLIKQIYVEEINTLNLQWAEVTAAFKNKK